MSLSNVLLIHVSTLFMPRNDQEERLEQEHEYYALLDLPKYSALPEIRKAYRRVSLRLQCDRMMLEWQQSSPPPSTAAAAGETSSHNNATTTTTDTTAIANADASTTSTTPNQPRPSPVVVEPREDQQQQQQDQLAALEMIDEREHQIKEAFRVLGDKHLRQQYHLLQCRPSRYRVIRGPLSVIRNLTHSRRWFPFLVLQSVILAAMINATTAHLENVQDWVLVLIPSWTYYGVVVLFWLCMLEPPWRRHCSWRSVSAMFAAFAQHACAWLGMFWMARYWDRDITIHDKAANWYILAIPFYLAIFFRCYCTVAVVASLRDLQAKMVSRELVDYVVNNNNNTANVGQQQQTMVKREESAFNNTEKSIAMGNIKNENGDDDDGREVVLPEGYIVVTRDAMLLAEHLQKLNMTEEDLQDYASDIQKSNAFAVETSPEFRQVDQAALSLQRAMVKLAVLGSIFITLVAVKLQEQLENLSFWIVFMPLWIYLGSRLYITSRAPNRSVVVNNRSSNNGTNTNSTTTNTASRATTIPGGTTTTDDPVANNTVVPEKDVENPAAAATGGGESNKATTTTLGTPKIDDNISSMSVAAADDVGGPVDDVAVVDPIATKSLAVGERIGVSVELALHTSSTIGETPDVSLFFDVAAAAPTTTALMPESPSGGENYRNLINNGQVVVDDIESGSSSARMEGRMTKTPGDDGIITVFLGKGDAAHSDIEANINGAISATDTATKETFDGDDDDSGTGDESHPVTPQQVIEEEGPASGGGGVYEEFERWQSVYENTEVRTLQSPYIPCEIIFQILILCLIVAKLDTDYGNKDPNNAGFNAFLIILIPFSFGFLVCCCAIAVGCAQLAREELNVRDAAVVNNAGNGPQFSAAEGQSSNNNTGTDSGAAGGNNHGKAPMEAGPGLYQRVSFSTHIDIPRKDLKLSDHSQVFAFALDISRTEAEAWLVEHVDYATTNNGSTTFWEQIIACADDLDCHRVNYDEEIYDLFSLKTMDKEWLILLRKNLQAHFDKSKFQNELDAIKPLDDDDDECQGDGDDEELGRTKNKMQENQQGVECPVCCESYNITDTVHCDGDPIHFFCRVCFHRYATETVQAGDTAGMPCADANCEASFSTPTVRSNLSPWEILRMEDRETDRNTKVALAAKAVLKCPCGMIGIVTEEEVGDGCITCPGKNCDLQYCALCGNKWHPETSCPPSKKMLQWLVKNTMPCPNCHTPIEKNAGCDHLYCAPPGGCGHHFSYRTGKPMSKSGRTLRGLYHT